MHKSQVNMIKSHFHIHLLYIICIIIIVENAKCSVYIIHLHFDNLLSFTICLFSISEPDIVDITKRDVLQKFHTNGVCYCHCNKFVPL